MPSAVDHLKAQEAKEKAEKLARLEAAKKRVQERKRKEAEEAARKKAAEDAVRAAEDFRHQIPAGSTD